MITTRGFKSRLRGRVLAGAAATGLALAGTLTPVLGSSPAAGDTNTVVVSEDFSGSTLPSGWNAVLGEWKVEKGRLYGTSVNSGQLSRITFGRHLTNFRFEVTARFESVQDAARWTALGLDVAADGSTPWSIATMRSGTTAPNGLEFAQRTTANTWNVTDTAPAPKTAGTGKDVRIAAEVRGNQARWFFNGTEVMRTTRVQRSLEGGQALLVNGSTVSFDNLKITELPSPAYIRARGDAMTVIAHRGASSAAPENTLASDEVARRAGADWIENDVQPTKDGVPVVLHDTTVNRTTNGSGRIRDLTSTEVADLDAGSWFAPMYAGQRVPTLAAQLADLRTRGGKLLLEIKGAHTREQVATIIQTVRDQDMADRVFVQSFEVDHLRYVRELAPELPLGLLRSTLDTDPVAIAKDLKLTSYNPSEAALMTRPDIVKDLHAAGIAVMVWTVDSPASWQRLEAAGIDGIITNRPAELLGWNAAYLQTRED
ncbi:glycerophosphodiester phosphodiesterase family protein [Actinopolymorpha alba]|uniref:glycerophosphodiester phosphodiesterase family protein n=1 Tax=Actinopolymorpha alba TaxID=533267 RepID=UPI0003719D7D|nr:glycerophosphodiester phosphodiesterase family protein [Actinopolymorpha alba]